MSVVEGAQAKQEGRQENGIRVDDAVPLRMVALREAFVTSATPKITSFLLGSPSRALPADDGLTISRFIEASAEAFFTHDLYSATRQLLAHAKGSFGLGMSHSLDATNELVMAARGQTISLAFYPQVRVSCWSVRAVT